MPISHRYKDLRKRVTKLRQHMLPDKFSPIGSYSDRVQDRARGYRLLVHAEIESYLEDIARSVVTDRIRNWKTSETPSNLLIAFLACYHSGWIEYDENNTIQIIERAKSRGKIKETVANIINQAQRQFITILKNNHGIKEINLKNLILPTGVEIIDLDSTWITNLDVFGEERGKTAHNTITVAGTIDPKDEYYKVKDLMKGLKDLDKKLSLIS